MTIDWVERARTVAATTVDAAAALDALDAEAPRAWRETVISALLCSPRSVEVQTALEATNRWMRWRAVLPTSIACTFLTLCHPNDVPLTCFNCKRRFAARHGFVFALTQVCDTCLWRKRGRAITNQCLGCAAKTTSGDAFCRTCLLQIDALSKQRATAPPPIPRDLHEMVRRRS